jgi:putative oxidoreductase
VRRDRDRERTRPLRHRRGTQQHEGERGNDLAVCGSREDAVLTRFLEPWTESAYLLVRVVAGLMFAFHGMQKLFGVLIESQPPVGSQVWFGALLELAAGVAIVAGFLTAWAAFLASGEMAVAYVQFHWKFDFGAKFFPAVNQGELALLYSVLFLSIACRGGGEWSLDRRRATAEHAP